MPRWASEAGEVTAAAVAPFVVNISRRGVGSSLNTPLGDISSACFIMQ